MGRRRRAGSEANILVNAIQSAAKFNLYISGFYSHAPPARLCLKCSWHINEIGLPGKTKAAHFLFISYRFTSTTGRNLPPLVYISAFLHYAKRQSCNIWAQLQPLKKIQQYQVSPKFSWSGRKSLASENSRFCACSFILNMNLPKFYMIKIYFKIYIVSYSSVKDL